MTSSKSMNSFDDWSEEEVREFLTQNQFIAFRQLESGEWIGLYQLMFTLSVCMDITPLRSFNYRWCFNDRNEAIYFFDNAKEFDEIPTKRTSLRGHRHNSEPLLIEYDELGYAKW